MNIRQAQAKDSFALSALLTELGYSATEGFIDTRLTQLIHHPDEMLLVAIRCWASSRCTLFRSWHWPAILPASATFVLPKASAAKAAGSSY